MEREEQTKTETPTEREREADRQIDIKRDSERVTRSKKEISTGGHM